MTRSPADAIVALRSLDRRWRGLLAGLRTDEDPDDLAHRIGADGHAVSDHAVRATRTLSLLDRALEQVLIDEATALHPAVGDATQREWDGQAGRSVDDLITELAEQAEHLAARADGVAASDWARRSPVAGQAADVGALEVLWDAVDSAIAELKAAERTLQEVRGRPA
ncbi:MAG TPA: hypothetical protein VGP53_08175 [Acidimicrobiales bacterium]|nr:hypothetical protein [Acidimicrobiales bacterium]